MTYAEKLKDPRWQKKRLEVLQRDNFTCVYCGDTETTLHVHHPYYKKGASPWEYDHMDLMTLCEDCHKVEHLKLSELERFLLSCLRNRDEDLSTPERKRLNVIVTNFINGEANFIRPHHFKKETRKKVTLSLVELAK